MDNCQCTVTQTREGETGSWCVACGRKVYEVDERECGGCSQYRDAFGGGGRCDLHRMRVSRQMHVTFKVEDGTCFTPSPM